MQAGVVLSVITMKTLSMTTTMPAVVNKRFTSVCYSKLQGKYKTSQFYNLPELKPVNTGHQSCFHLCRTCNFNFTFLQCKIFRRIDSRQRKPRENEIGFQNLNFLPVTTIHLTLVQGFPPCWSFVAASWEIAGPFPLQFKRSKGTALKKRIKDLLFYNTVVV